MTRILFHAINGEGLGHIMRCGLVARELFREMPCEIAFATNSSQAGRLGFRGVRIITGGVDHVDLRGKKTDYSAYLEQNSAFVEDTINRFSPQIFITDQLILPKALLLAKRKGIFCVYIARELASNAQLRDNVVLTRLFDLVLATGCDGRGLLKDLRAFGFAKAAVFFVGQIFRPIDRKAVSAVRKKYRGAWKGRLVTVTAGGGGGRAFQEDTKRFFEEVSAAARELAATDSGRAGKRPVRWVFIKGPLASFDFSVPEEAVVKSFEPNLPELFAISDLVISTGGFNSVHEIIASRIPGLVFPLAKRFDPQMRRAQWYARRGAIKVIRVPSKEEISRLCNDILDRVCKGDRGQPRLLKKTGAIGAARLIRKHYDTFMRHRSRGLGILRSVADPVHEHFIYEELQRLPGYKPFLLCQQVVDKDNAGMRIHLQRMLKIPWRGEYLSMVPPRKYDELEALMGRYQAGCLVAEFLRDAIPYLLFARKRNIPVISFYRGFELSDIKVQKVLEVLSSVCRCVIARSKFQKEELVRSGFDAGKIRVIYGGVDVRKIPFQPRGAAGRGFRLMSAGRLVEKKGFDVLLDAVVLLKKRGFCLPLTIVGQGILEPAIRDRIRKLGLQEQIALKPFLVHDEFLRELGRHNIFILASKTASNGDREGIPNVLKEAMASGMVTVSTRHAGIPELIRDGVNGYLVEENNASALADRLEAICQAPSLNNRLCAAARGTIEKKFRLEEAQDRLVRVFDQVLA